MFKRVLIANRGEIAIRVIRCLREMEIDSVAVYSDVDRNSLHVRWADQAVHLPGVTGAETYMHMDRLLEAADRTGADAIHPGYGFLSEQPDFARRCEAAGIAFIGPNANAIEKMGDKTAARNLMQSAGVPIVPGYQAHDASSDEILQAARSMGFPVMLKAAAGGGGKGMRLVREERQLLSSLEQARSEAMGAFGDQRVYLEKFIESPRHIEVQVVCDKHGHGIHLGERECSIQRRHQKVVEEAPSPVVDVSTRSRLGAIALRAARAVNYDSVGTIEFLRDRDGAFYFLEMNTRLQVEHPVTEWITGLDLVQLQTEIAADKELSLSQDDVRFWGHAMECRIYAEDPVHDFRPSPGVITHLITPNGNGVRDDSGVYQGFEVPMYYDPLISKLSTWATTRRDAVIRMSRALEEYKIGGIQSNLGFHRQLMRNPDFLEGRFDTGFIDRHPDLTRPSCDEDLQRIALIAASIKYFKDQSRQSLNGDSAPSTESKWRRAARRYAMTGGI